MASKQWRCFFCDEVFTSKSDARIHFGAEGCTSDVPACIDPLRQDEKARMTELREAQMYAAQCRDEAQQEEERADNLAVNWAEIRRAFGDDCTSIWQLCDRYKSALNRIADLESLEKVG